MSQLTPGDPAPALVLPDSEGRTVDLAALRDTAVVVYFYPAAMTPGCTTQACDFRDNLASLTGAGYRVIGVSPDEPAALATFVERDSLTFPLLSDPSHETMERWGAWGEKKLYGKPVTGVIRSTVVVGTDGTVQLARYNVRAKGHVASLRRALGLD